jgi:hypothetical protein
MQLPSRRVTPAGRGTPHLDAGGAEVCRDVDLRVGRAQVRNCERLRSNRPPAFTSNAEVPG